MGNSPRCRHLIDEIVEVGRLVGGGGSAGGEPSIIFRTRFAVPPNVWRHSLAALAAQWHGLAALAAWRHSWRHWRHKLAAWRHSGMAAFWRHNLAAWRHSWRHWRHWRHASGGTAALAALAALAAYLWRHWRHWRHTLANGGIVGGTGGTGVPGAIIFSSVSQFLARRNSLQFSSVSSVQSVSFLPGGRSGGSVVAMLAVPAAAWRPCWPFWRQSGGSVGRSGGSVAAVLVAAAAQWRQ